jgi:ribonuclease T1
MRVGRALSGLLLAAVVLIGCQAAPSSAPPATGPVAVADAIPDCAVESLPPEAHEVIEDIEAGGPYEYPRNDGVTFGNREGLLPDEEPGYYREFTVETPGLDHRGARRIVTGGPDERDPEHWYYTADHYESFCEFVPPPG